MGTTGNERPDGGPAASQTLAVLSGGPALSDAGHEMRDHADHPDRAGEAHHKELDEDAAIARAATAAALVVRAVEDDPRSQSHRAGVSGL